MLFSKEKTALATFWSTIGNFAVLLIPASGHTAPDDTII